MHELHAGRCRENGCRCNEVGAGGHIAVTWFGFALLTGLDAFMLTDRVMYGLAGTVLAASLLTALLELAHRRAIRRRLADAQEREARARALHLRVSSTDLDAVDCTESHSLPTPPEFADPTPSSHSSAAFASAYRS